DVGDRQRGGAPGRHVLQERRRHEDHRHARAEGRDEGWQRRPAALSYRLVAAGTTAASRAPAVTARTRGRLSRMPMMIPRMACRVAASTIACLSLAAAVRAQTPSAAAGGHAAVSPPDAVVG